MFRQLAFRLNTIPPVDAREVLFDKHPLELAALLEQAYEQGQDLPPEPPGPLNPRGQESLGHPNHRSDVKPIVQPAFLGPFPFPNAPVPSEKPLEVRWDHLIYAYMIENTRIYEIFHRVLFEFLHGEKIGTPLPESQNWLRSTEELFYRDPAPFLITSVASHIRRDLRSSRRNAYQRMHPARNFTCL